MYEWTILGLKKKALFHQSFLPDHTIIIAMTKINELKFELINLSTTTETSDTNKKKNILTNIWIKFVQLGNI